MERVLTKIVGIVSKPRFRNDKHGTIFGTIRVTVSLDEAVDHYNQAPFDDAYFHSLVDLRAGLGEVSDSLLKKARLESPTDPALLFFWGDDKPLPQQPPRLAFESKVKAVDLVRSDIGWRLVFDVTANIDSVDDPDEVLLFCARAFGQHVAMIMTVPSILDTSANVGYSRSA